VKTEGLSLNKKDFMNGEKSKSNLLSTGIINLSQRLDHDKLPSELIKTSKGNIFNRSIAESSSNQIK
jgi:Fe-S cluster assembly scaffold protein SufB